MGTYITGDVLVFGFQNPGSAIFLISGNPVQSRALTELRSLRHRIVLLPRSGSIPASLRMSCDDILRWEDVFGVQYLDSTDRGNSKSFNAYLGGPILNT